MTRPSLSPLTLPSFILFFILHHLFSSSFFSFFSYHHEPAGHVLSFLFLPCSLPSQPGHSVHLLDFSPSSLLRLSCLGPVTQANIRLPSHSFTRCSGITIHSLLQSHISRRVLVTASIFNSRLLPFHLTTTSFQLSPLVQFGRI